jgi:hypothetical protein
MIGAIPPLPQHAFVAWYSVKKAQEQIYIQWSLVFWYDCDISLSSSRELISSLQVLPLKFCMNFSSLPCVLNVPPISFSLIRSPLIVFGYSSGLRAGWLGFRVPAEAGNFPHHRVRTGYEALPAYYPMGIRGSFPGGKAAWAWSWRPTFI